jgi:holo-[acyl-carrier protein] synthase
VSDHLTAVGLDLIEIARVERALERRPRLAERLFTDAELRFARSRRRPGRHLAARFAAKEATIKALGGAPIAPREVEVAGGGGEPPELKVHGRAAAAAAEAGVALELSLTHSEELAAAIVVATTR